MRDPSVLGHIAIAFAILAHAWQRYPRPLTFFTTLAILSMAVASITFWNVTR